MGVVGFGMIQCTSASNTVIQSPVPEYKRGRVMGHYVKAFVGAAPFGSLLAGGLAHLMEAPAAVITGAFCVAGSLWFLLDLPKIYAIIRPLYQQGGSLAHDPASLVAEATE